MSAIGLVAAAFGFGYLLGSIPFGLLLTRLAGLGDVRSIGSGNIGATNVLRTGNRKLAAATLVADILKGTAAAAIAQRWGVEFAVAAGFGAFIGHLYPVWLNLKGGKGVATFLGVLLAFAWQAALAFAAIWLFVAWLSRYSSLAALVATVSTPIVLFALGLPDIAGMFAVMGALVLWKHKENIQRLRHGTESKIGAKK
ncbi:MAG: glycerol-3-phosphate 1-O-acyltransferase PlsY [Phyllobacteriaceae bacterium]|nr:glycerol-3-phosphate 1-O-acyltransferase PlsY [Phyllobacteriaceae bacterium]